MKPGLILPRAAPNDAILAERIDEHVRSIATYVNGGISAESVIPTNKIAATAFAERQSIFVMNHNFASPAVQTTYTLGLLPPGVTSRVIGLSVVKQGYISASAAPTSASVRYSVGVAGSTIFTSPILSPYNLLTGKTIQVNSSTQYTLSDLTTATAYYNIDSNYSFAAGSIVNVIVTADTTFQWQAVYVILACTHVA